LLAEYSVDYASARGRFRAAARAAGARGLALALDARGPGDTDLTIDIAWLGAGRPRRVVLHTSGIHGVEAFHGSAIQLHLLARPPQLAADSALVLVHALNPFGMAWLRRANENNVDLNRNFLLPGEAYSGAPDHYAALDPLLNPPSAPGFDLFLPRVALRILRHGFQPLKQAIAGGQYAFPQGLFFGGTRLEQGPALYLDWLRKHLAGTAYVLALDAHSGLGRFGEQLLIEEPAACATDPARLGAALGHSIATQRSDDAYVVRGGYGAALAHALAGTAVDFVTQEIGTRAPLAIIQALREENRAHHHCDGGGIAHPAKRRLLEALSPAAPQWRAKALSAGVELVRRAVAFCNDS